MSAGKPKRMLEIQHSEYFSPSLNYDDEEDDEAVSVDLPPINSIVRDRRSRVTSLYGVSAEPKKKKKSILNKIGKSMKKLST